jgi:hypothetical protein
MSVNQQQSIIWRNYLVHAVTPVMITTNVTCSRAGNRKASDSHDDEAARQDSFEKIMRESASLMFGDDLCREPEYIEDVAAYEDVGSNGEELAEDRGARANNREVSSENYAHAGRSALMTQTTAIATVRLDSTNINQEGSFLRSSYDYFLRIERKFPSNIAVPPLDELSLVENSLDEFLQLVRSLY